MIKHFRADFGDLVSFELSTQDPQALAYFRSEYAHHKGSGAAPDSQVRLRWQSSRLPFSPGQGYQFHTHKALARWYYRIQFGSDRIEIDVCGNRTAIPMVHHMLVHPSLRYVTSQRDWILLHASAVARGGQSVVFSGAGGAGKTTTTSILLAEAGEAWGLHADDYVFIGPGGTTRRYLTRSHLYRSHLGFVPELGERLSLEERLQLEFFGRLRSFTRDGIKWPVRKDPASLWRGQVEEGAAALGALVLLERSRGATLELEPQDLNGEALDHLLENNFHEARHYRRLVEAAPDPPAEVDWWGGWRAREEELLRTHLEGVMVYRLTFPARAPERKEVAAAIRSLKLSRETDPEAAGAAQAKGS